MVDLGERRRDERAWQQVVGVLDSDIFGLGQMLIVNLIILSNSERVGRGTHFNFACSVRLPSVCQLVFSFLFFCLFVFLKS